MEKSITVEKIIKEVKKYENNESKIDYIKSVVKSENYIPYTKKYAYAKSLVTDTSYHYETDENGKSNRTSIIEVNSPMREMFKIWTVINLYTNIDLKPENKMQDYDLMEEYGITKMILEVIPENELKTFGEMVLMCMDDFMVNKSDVKNSIMEVISFAVSAFSREIEKFMPMLDEVSKVLDNADGVSKEELSEKIVSIVDKVNKL